MALEVSDFGVAYGPVRAVTGARVEVPERSVIAVIGPNGAGKTSLLRAVMGQVKASGRVAVDGTDISRRSVHARCRLGLGFVPDGRGVFPGLTVREHIRVAAGAHAEERWSTLIQTFPVLEEKQAALGSQLSGGQQQILSIARALASQPRYVLLDEPSMGLSPIAIRQVVDAIARLSAYGVGVLLAEQNVGLALKVSARCHVMVRGEIQLSGTPEEISANRNLEALYLARTEAMSR
jgi:branched-chain amino acid transport system ATP-binding protein